MSRSGDPNPHFVRPYPSQYPEQLPQTSPPSSLVPLPQHTEPPQVEPEKPVRRPRKHPAGKLVSFHPGPEEEHPGPDPQTVLPPDPSVPTHQHPRKKNQDQQTQPAHEGEQHPQKIPPIVSTVPALYPEQSRPSGSQGQLHGRHTHPHGLHRPRPQQTNVWTWSGAICCAIFWVIIILTGVVVLIIYLVFRPRTPKFDVSSATLNAAYLDMGYLLNADVTVLANFTNPNKKVSVDFSNLIIDLYYGNTRIASQYVEPFSAQRRHSMFANVHMVASQVRLGVLESLRLRKEMDADRARFDVKGYFRARANFGKILRYSYWLHGDCQVVLTRPPDGVMVTRKCKTKQ